MIMQTRTSLSRKGANSTRPRRPRSTAAKQPFVSHRASSPSHDVAAVREMADELLGKDVQNADLVSRVVIALARRASEAERDTARLRAWQHLLSDLAVALGQIDAQKEEGEVRTIANGLRKTIRQIDRNPENRLAVRPASRRILDALQEEGGSGTFATIRQRSRHSDNHFSNSLKPLMAHGLVEARKDENDRRRKTLLLTARGRDALTSSGKVKLPDSGRGESSPSKYVAAKVVTSAGAQSYLQPGLARIDSQAELTG